MILGAVVSGSRVTTVGFRFCRQVPMQSSEPVTTFTFESTKSECVSDRVLPSHSPREQAARIIANGSKSFALAGRVLPPTERLDAHLIYAWCRYADDAIDNAPPSERKLSLTRLRDELTGIYASTPLNEPLWMALREVVQRRSIPQCHFETLLDGMGMDVVGTTYQTLDELRLYCHRVAGVVGWLMVGVLGIATPKALRSAAHLGIAMQLTNICRDVAEDWHLGRLYLPNELLAHHGAKDLHLRLGSAFPAEQKRPVAETVRELLDLADHHYEIGDDGLAALSARSAF